MVVSKIYLTLRDDLQPTSRHSRQDAAPPTRKKKSEKATAPRAINAPNDRKGRRWLRGLCFFLRCFQKANQSVFTGIYLILKSDTS